MTILYDSLLSVCFFALVSFVFTLLKYYKSGTGYVMGANAPAILLGWMAFLTVLIYQGIADFLTQVQKISLLSMTFIVAIAMCYIFYNRLVKSESISRELYLRNVAVVGLLLCVFMWHPYNAYHLKVAMAVLVIMSGLLIIGVQKMLNKNDIHFLWTIFLGLSMTILSMSLYLEYKSYDAGMGVLQAIAIIVFAVGLAINYTDTNNKATAGKINELEQQNRKLFEAEVQVLKYAYKDQVTGLPNYVSFQSTVNNNLNNRQAKEAYLLFMDLDDFRRVNTVVGFAEGNDILRKCGDVITGVMPSGDNLFRVNGSRFAMVHHGDMSSSQALARSIIEVVNGSDDLRTNMYFRQGISIGMTLIDRSRDFNTIVNQAEMAMYKVKEHKKNDFEFFNELHEREYKNLLELEGKLKNATNDNVWNVYLQPQVDVKSGKIQGLEALIRWFDGERYIPPDEFIPLAEKNGLIVRIGDDVIKKVFSLMKDCQQKHQLDIKFSINVSAVEMFDYSFVDRISNYIDCYGVDPSKITLELTETAILGNIEEAQAIMEDLRNMKVSISIDDFGSGFTSLSYLSRLPIDEVKIDKGFIDHISDNEKDRIMLGHFTELCHDLGLKVVAEGIETEDQLEYIKGIGCDLYQGYYFSKPLSYEKMCQSFSKANTHKTS